MDVRVRQTRNEILSGAVYDDGIGRHLDLGFASNFRNAVAAHQHGPALFHSLVIQGNSARVDERHGRSWRFLS